MRMWHGVRGMEASLVSYRPNFLVFFFFLILFCFQIVKHGVQVNP